MNVKKGHHIFEDITRVEIVPEEVRIYNEWMDETRFESLRYYKYIEIEEEK